LGKGRNKGRKHLSMIVLTALFISILTSLTAGLGIFSPITVQGARFKIYQGTSVTLECFYGEGSYFDGYDFSEQAVQRVLEGTPDKPNLNPDFYIYEYQYIFNQNHQIIGELLGPKSGADPASGWVPIIDYGEVGINAVTEVPSPSDPRFQEQGFQVGHTYGMFTKEGNYVVLHIDSQYPYMQVEYNDWYKDGITFTWKYVSGQQPPTIIGGELGMELYSDKEEYALGENPVIYGIVTMNDKRVEDAVVNVRVLNEYGVVLSGGSAKTDENGQFALTLRYGVEIPENYQGLLEILANASYMGAEAEAGVEIAYGFIREGEISIILTADKHEYQAGEAPIITGMVTLNGEPIEGATITLQAFDEDGELIVSYEDETDFEGEFEWDMEPINYVGEVRIVATASYGESSAEAEIIIRLTGAALSLELHGPEGPIKVGEYLGIGGWVTCMGSPVADAEVRMEVMGKIYTTHTRDDGGFAYYFDTRQWYGGEYAIKVTVSKEGYKPATGEMHFTLIGKGYQVKIKIYAEESYDAGTEAEIRVFITLKEEPLQHQWIQVNVTTPSGEIQNFPGETDENGLFIFKLLVMEAGNYTVKAFTYYGEVLIIGEEKTFKVLAQPPPPSKPTMIIPVIVDFNASTRVKVGEAIEVSGRLMLREVDQSTGEILSQSPQSGWKVEVSMGRWWQFYGENPCLNDEYYTGSWLNQTVITDDNGTFHFKFLAPPAVGDFGLGVWTCEPSPVYQPKCVGNGTYIRVYVGASADIELKKKQYVSNELLEGTITVFPDMKVAPGGDCNSPWHSWGELETMITIIGPKGEERVYELSSSNITVEKFCEDFVKIRFQWSISDYLDAGDYEIKATIIGDNLEMIKLGTVFELKKASRTLLTVQPELCGEIWSEGVGTMDPWSPGFIIGNYTDIDGAPIPGAKINITAVNSDNPVQKIQLNGITDSNGAFKISLEKLNYFAGMQPKEWELIIHASKEGYVSAVSSTYLYTPTICAYLDVLEISPELDYLVKHPPKGDNSEPIPLNIKLKIRYTSLDDDNGLIISTWGDWSTLPKSPNELPLPKGIGRIIEVEIHGKVFNIPYPPNYELEGIHVSITQRAFEKLLSDLGRAHSVEIYYPPTEFRPKLNVIDAEAWINPAKKPVHTMLYGKEYVFDAPGVLKARVGSTIPSSHGSSEFKNWVALRNKPISLVPQEMIKDKWVPTDLISVQSSAITNNDGWIIVPLDLKKDVESLKSRAFGIKITVEGIAGEDVIPVRIILPPKVELNIKKLYIIQPIDLPTRSFSLVSMKPAAVRAYIEIKGEVNQPPNAPLVIDAKMIVKVAGKIQTVRETSLRVSENTPETPWAKKSQSSLTTFTSSQTQSKEGKKIVFVDFYFIPRTKDPSSPLEITVILDPHHKLSKGDVQKIEGKVVRMKRLVLLVVPVDTPPSPALSTFIAKQVSLLKEVYPLSKHDILYFIEEKYNPWVIKGMVRGEQLRDFRRVLLGETLAEKYVSATFNDSVVRVVAVLPDTSVWWGEGESGVTYWSNPYVVFVRDGTVNEYVLAHELGHSLGLYRFSPTVSMGKIFIDILKRAHLISEDVDEEVYDQEEYELFKPFGLEVHGHILKNGKVYFIPENWQNEPSDWKEAFWPACYIKNARFFGVFDIMGNAEYDNRDYLMAAWIHETTYLDLQQVLVDPGLEPLMLVQGMVFRNGSAVLYPPAFGWGEPRELAGRGDYEVRVTSLSGQVLYSVKFGKIGGDSAFTFILPFKSGAAKIVIVNEEGDVIAKLSKTTHSPAVKINSIKITDEGFIDIEWKAEDVDGDDMTYDLLYKCDEGFWIPVASGVSENSYRINASMLPGGDACSVMAIASDGFNVGSDISKSFKVQSKPPTAIILTELSSYLDSEEIILKGFAYDLEDGVLGSSNIKWFSDKDGYLGNGSSIRAKLSPGSHVIIMKAVDSSGAVGETSVKIKVMRSEATTSTTFITTRETTGAMTSEAQITSIIIDKLKGYLVIIIDKLKEYLVPIIIGIVAVAVMAGAVAAIRRGRRTPQPSPARY